MPGTRLFIQCVDEVVEKEIPSSLQFPENLKVYEEVVNNLIHQILTTSVGDATLGGAVIGGAMGGVSRNVPRKESESSTEENEGKA